MSRRRAPRRRVNPTRSKRPIDKRLKFVTATADSTQVNTELHDSVFPSTVMGLRWDLQAIQLAGTGTANGAWIIVVAHDGNTPNTLSFGNNSDFYTPEQDVMAYGTWTIDNNVNHQSIVGQTKTMRKLRVGDKVFFSFLGVATNTSQINGVIQFFLKT